jgi:hypothetical protein
MIDALRIDPPLVTMMTYKKILSGFGAGAYDGSSARSFLICGTGAGLAYRKLNQCVRPAGHDI